MKHGKPILSDDFYIRERRPKNPFFVLDKNLKGALLCFALALFYTVIFLATLYEESEITQMFFGGVK